jgi:hypothetical protein
MIQCLAIIDVFVIFIRFRYSQQQIEDYNIIRLGSYVLIALMVGLIAFNYFKYNGKYNLLKNKWKHETKIQRTIRGYLVLFSLVLPWVPLLLSGFIASL